MSIPNQICSKCHEDFMHCKCTQFYPNIQTFLTICPNCSKEIQVESPRFQGYITDIHHEIFDMNELRAIYQLVKHMYIPYENQEIHQVINKIAKIVKEEK